MPRQVQPGSAGTEKRPLLFAPQDNYDSAGADPGADTAARLVCAATGCTTKTLTHFFCADSYFKSEQVHTRVKMHSNLKPTKFNVVNVS